MAEPFTFSWHEENKSNSFLGWVFLVLMSEGRKSQSDAIFDEVAAASDDFENIELSISANGVELPAQDFIDRLEQGMERQVGIEAQRLIQETFLDATDGIGDLAQMMEAIQDIQRRAKNEMLGALKAKGFELVEEEE